MRSLVFHIVLVSMFVIQAAPRAEASVFAVDLVATSGTTVGPGGSVSYELVGVFTEDPGLGLAAWGIDLQSSYSIVGGLPQLAPGPEMGSFLFVTNPAGYGGTPFGDDLLVQIGGAQDTIGDPGPFTFVEDIGATSVVLATGVANLPEAVGSYSLELSNLFGNVATGGGPEVYTAEAFTAVISTPTLEITVIPEPATAVLLALGLVTLQRRRR